ncbi:hypothetical protein [Nocardioides sp.]|uniref:hypothetical protein n=1 Tax=Nocardioides sp. TaxID=35761 RepID=UPI002625EA77|nr:hypothetical protein [Nocardioides sp.]
MTTTEMTPAAESDTTLVDRDGSVWKSFSGIWYRREPNGAYGACRGTPTMLDRDFGPLTRLGSGSGDE